MRQFTLVDAASGRVVDRLQCSEPRALDQVRDGLELVPEWFDREVRFLIRADGGWAPAEVGSQPTVGSAEREAHLNIDAAAGAARLRFITDVPGQQAVYMMKLGEARAVASDPGATAPHIHAEAAATGCTPAEVAATVIGMADLWNTVLSPAIEAARIGGKAAVSAAAQTGAHAAITAAAEAAIAQLDAIAPPA